MTRKLSVHVALVESRDDGVSGVFQTKLIRLVIKPKPPNDKLIAPERVKPKAITIKLGCVAMIIATRPYTNNKKHKAINHADNNQGRIEDGCVLGVGMISSFNGFQGSGFLALHLQKQ